MKKVSSLVLSCLTTALVWINSLLPGTVSGAQSSFFSAPIARLLNDFLNWPVDPDIIHAVIRKMAHFVEFSIVGGLWCLTIFLHGWGRKKETWIAIAIAGAVALCDETIQIFVPGRAFSVWDIAIDVLGGLFGAFFVQGWMIRKEKKILF